MHLVSRLDDLPLISPPCGLTIGTFDGVHLGHQQLLTHLRSQVSPKGIVAVCTFANHPAHLLSPLSAPPLIYPPLQKARYLFDCGADLVLLLPFTRELAELPFDPFLRTLKKQLQFEWLTLGEGASFGKNRQGDAKHIEHLSHSLQFTATYLPKLSLHHQPISSRRIRELIEKGAFQEVSHLLGRPYTLTSTIAEKEGLLFCPLPGLCLPPEKDYPVRITSATALSCTARVSHAHAGLYLQDSSLKPLLGKEVEIEF